LMDTNHELQSKLVKIQKKVDEGKRKLRFLSSATPSDIESSLKGRHTTHTTANLRLSGGCLNCGCISCKNLIEIVPESSSSDTEGKASSTNDGMFIDECNQVLGEAGLSSSSFENTVTGSDGDESIGVLGKRSRDGKEGKEKTTKKSRNTKDDGAVRSKKRVWKWNDIYDALKLYMVIKNKDKGTKWTVSQNFVISKADHPDWPDVLCGMDLGNIMNNIRRDNTHSEHRDELVELNYCLDVQHPLTWDMVKSCFEIYMALPGNEEKTNELGWKMQKGFIMKTEDGNWPPLAIGKNLYRIHLGIVGERATYSDVPKNRAEALAMNIVMGTKKGIES